MHKGSTPNLFSLNGKETETISLVTPVLNVLSHDKMAAVKKVLDKKKY